MEPEDYAKLLKRFQSDECTPEEADRLNEWYTNLELHSIKQPSVEEKDALVQENWEKIKLIVLSSPTTRRSLIFGQPLRWAAIAAMVIGIGWLLLIQNKTSSSSTPSLESHIQLAQHLQNTQPDEFIKKHFNDTDQLVTLTLRDQSTIVLHPGSTLTYTEDFGLENRIVHLTGTAFFNVQKNPALPFYIYTKEIATKVLGTSFTINANPNESQIKIAVKTGKVIVFELREPTQNTQHSLQDQEITITPNQQIVYNEIEKKLTKSLVEHPEVLVSLDQQETFTFQNTPLPRILAALERAYGVTIDYDSLALGQCVLTTSIEDKDLFHKLTVLSTLLDAQLEIVDTKISFIGGKCL